ncbi:HpcH/HpaI aldolase/citrate lyase family protein [Variovorax sp. RHLX14]|uniref:HpcH/HpaI aldolase/citrate lyase family protein n=1 Tax=Variovorax sp. RHLX14 TaxID=1259731 RepID=UPI003F48FCDF
MSAVSSPLAAARTFLFVPADRPERFAKALASGADAVIVDLEDAVAPDARPGARAALLAAWPEWPSAMRARTVVRINAEGTPSHSDDMALVRTLGAGGLGAVMLAKAERAEPLVALGDVCPDAALIALIESGAGLDALDAIAKVSGVVRLALGHIDLQVDLGIACGPDEAEVAPARWALVRASRRAGRAAPIDGVTTETRDMAVVESAAAKSLRYGFGGKLCIHPAQVAAVHAAFMPGEDELVLARRIVQAAEASGGGSCAVDGRMVDAPVIAMARRTLARAAAT